MWQLDVKPSRRATMLPHQLRVGAAQRGERFVESFAESFVHSAHRQLSTVLLVGVSLRNRLGLIGGGGVAQEAGLHFVGIGEAPVPNVETRGPPNNEILPSHGVRFASRESISIQSVVLQGSAVLQGSGHGVAPQLLAATSTLKTASAPQARANATLQI